MRISAWWSEFLEKAPWLGKQKVQPSPSWIPVPPLHLEGDKKHANLFQRWSTFDWEDVQVRDVRWLQHEDNGTWTSCEGTPCLNCIRWDFCKGKARQPRSLLCSILNNFQENTWDSWAWKNWRCRYLSQFSICKWLFHCDPWLIDIYIYSIQLAESHSDHAISPNRRYFTDWGFPCKMIYISRYIRICKVCFHEPIHPEFKLALRS